MTNPKRHRRSLSLILAATVALSLSGCSRGNTVSDSKGTSQTKAVPSAKVLYESMRKNVAAAKSVRIKGEVTTGGKKITIDIAGDRDGKSTRAVVNDGTGQVELLTAGGNVYVKADAVYWTKKASASAAKVAAGKYVKIPAGTGADELRVGSLLDGAFTDLPLSGVLQKVETTDVDGTPAYLLADRIGGEGKIYVSADGTARLLRLVSTKTNTGTLDFSEWDAVPPISAPSPDQLVKIPGQ
jgi:hypothetical protein